MRYFKYINIRVIFRRTTITFNTPNADEAFLG